MHISVEQFVWKCTECARLIRGQEALKMQWGITKSYQIYVLLWWIFPKNLTAIHQQLVWKCVASAQTIRGRWKFNAVWPNLNQLNQNWEYFNDNSNKFVQYAWKVYGQSKARIGWKFNEVWPKVNQVCGTPNEYFHYVCPEMRRKYVVCQKPRNGRNSVWSATKSPWGLWTPLIRIYTKFEVNPMISMPRNVQKLNA